LLISCTEEVEALTKSLEGIRHVAQVAGVSLLLK
jgi:hypothetical protein